MSINKKVSLQMFDNDEDSLDISKKEKKKMIYNDEKLNINNPNPNNNDNYSNYKDFDESVNRNYWYRGELMQLVSDYQKELINNQEVVIEQKIELLEILSGCETANRYNVYLLDKNKQKKFLFKCKEESSWFCRNCLPSNTRAFILKMIHIKNSSKENDYKKNIAIFERPFKCTCLCCFRPEMTATFTNEKNNVNFNNNNNNNNDNNNFNTPFFGNLGKIVESFSCNPVLYVYGENGQLRWKIFGEYCQCGFCCRHVSIGKCYEVDFWIYDANSDIKNTRPVGNIHKVFKGLSELITDSDAFILTFPKKATAFERLMLIGSVIMIDYRYYEEMAMCDCGSII
jgi:hypothetical protein